MGLLLSAMNNSALIDGGLVAWLKMYCVCPLPSELVRIDFFFIWQQVNAVACLLSQCTSIMR